MAGYTIFHVWGGELTSDGLTKADPWNTEARQAGG